MTEVANFFETSRSTIADTVMTARILGMCSEHAWYVITPEKNSEKENNS
jgi:hypothetical protein